MLPGLRSRILSKIMEETENKIKSLEKYTDKELIWLIENHDLIESIRLPSITAEVLKRMNQRREILPDYSNHDWSNILTP